MKLSFWVKLIPQTVTGGMTMKKVAVFFILACLLTAGCGEDQKADPIYSQEETLVQGESDEETSLAPHTGALASAQLGELDTKQVTWGPGRIYGVYPRYAQRRRGSGCFFCNAGLCKKRTGSCAPYD